MILGSKQKFYASRMWVWAPTTVTVVENAKDIITLTTTPPRVTSLVLNDPNPPFFLNESIRILALGVMCNV